jgi:hypothetical protein
LATKNIKYSEKLKDFAIHLASLSFVFYGSGLLFADSGGCYVKS